MTKPVCDVTLAARLNAGRLAELHDLRKGRMLAGKPVGNAELIVNLRLRIFLLASGNATRGAVVVNRLQLVWCDALRERPCQVLRWLLLGADTCSHTKQKQPC